MSTNKIIAPAIYILAPGLERSKLAFLSRKINGKNNVNPTQNSKHKKPINLLTHSLLVFGITSYRNRWMCLYLKN